MMLRRICILLSNRFRYITPGNNVSFGHNLFLFDRICCSNLAICNTFGTSSVKLTSTKDILTAVTKKVKVKKPPIPQVTLEGPDGNIMTVTNMEECERIAERRGLKLVKISDATSVHLRPIYRLMTDAQYMEEDLKEKKDTKAKHQMKGRKLIMMSSRISEHDLSMKIKKINNWLTKKYEVRIIISTVGTDKTILEKFYKEIEEKTKGNGVLVQKRYKENDVRFQILPPKEFKIAGEDKNKSAACGNENTDEESAVDNNEYSNEESVDDTKFSDKDQEEENQSVSQNKNPDST